MAYCLHVAPSSFADIAQLGERQTEDLKVPGSIPGGGINFFASGLEKNCACVCGCRWADSRHGILAEWLRRLIRNQLGTFPREFESLRCRFFVFWVPAGGRFVPSTPPPSTAIGSRGAMDSAPDFESGGCGFESRRECFLFIL